jgi:tRNA pseudouridine55 synthase
MKEKTIINGVLNIDKPPGMTSHDVVARIRRFLKPKTYNLPPKVGHTGTLDPFATGVLLVVVGPATRLIQFTHAWDKEYEATFTLGAASDTDDVTGIITPPSLPLSGETKNSPPDKGEIEGVLKTFVGVIKQRPPAYSAVKIKGKKLYEYARAGNVAAAGESQSRAVVIHNIKIVDFAYPKLTLQVRCGTGTYIRSIARDLGEKLGTGAYVSSLRRTRIGPLDMSNSILLDKLSTAYPHALMSPSTLIAHLPSLTLTSHNIEALRQGQTVHLTVDCAPETPMALYDEQQALSGIGTWSADTRLLSPTINL